jgi:hypothetical protein
MSHTSELPSPPSGAFAIGISFDSKDEPESSGPIIARLDRHRGLAGFAIRPFAIASIGACLLLCGFGGATAIAAEGPSTEIECEGDACQPLPPEPEDPTPGTLGTGPTNPPLKGSKPKHHSHRKHGQSHRGKHRGGGR